jgi:hypothetical protein
MALPMMCNVGGMDIYSELLHGWDVIAGLGFLVPFVVGLVIAVKYSDSVSALAEMRDGYKKAIVPLLSVVPTWVSSPRGLANILVSHTTAFLTPVLPC